MLRAWYRKFANPRFQTHSQRGRPAARRQVLCRPQLEFLEGRLTPSVTVGTSSLIQSDYYLNGSVHGRFDAVVNGCAGQLDHYYNNGEGSGWHQGEQIVPTTSGPGSTIQSDWVDISPLDGNPHGHWEVLVPRNNHIEHWWSSGSSWHLGATFANGATAASFIQSDYYGYDPQYGWHRYMEAVVTQGTNLVHYINPQDGTGWQQAETIVSGVSGQGSIIQSDWVSPSTRNGFIGEQHGHFEVVVRVNNHIEHWWNDGGSKWNFDSSFANNVAAGPASIIQSDWLSFNPYDGNWHGHFEVLVPQFGGNLVHWVNNNDGSPWYQAETVSSSVTLPACLIQSDWTSLNPYDGNWHGHFEVLLSYGNDLWHFVNPQDGSPWYGAARIAACIFGPAGGSWNGSGSGAGVPLVDGANVDAVFAAANPEDQGFPSSRSKSQNSNAADSSPAQGLDRVFADDGSSLLGSLSVDDLALALLK
jgi:hypothetical protein